MAWPFNWFKKKPEAPKPEPVKPRPLPSSTFSTHLVDSLNREELFDRYFTQPEFKNPETGKKYAMDASLSDPYSNNPYATKNAFITNTQRLPDSLLSWYGNQGFIGYQSCAIFAQHWLIDKACSMPAEDACRNGWKVTVNDGEEEDESLMAQIGEFDKRFRVRQHLSKFVKFKRVFGIRIALFVVESSDPDYYLKPFNPDGIKPGSYKGIAQVDPYWMTPYMGEDSIGDPASLHFYEPTWWMIGGKRYHRSHLIIARHSEVADIIKPSYLYGGIPLTQQIYERVYASERTANEAPLLAMTKRMNIVKADLDKIFQNPEKFMQRMAEQVALRDNMGTRVISTEEDYVQHETSLADLDSVIMTQYQLVAAIAEVPATKLLGTSPKGFNATGEHEVASYHEMLASLQAHDMQPVLERHYMLLSKSEFDGRYIFDVVWNPLDEPTEEELANVNKIKADTFATLANTGAVDGEDIREALVKDPQSGFSGLSMEGFELPEDDTEEEPPASND